MATTPFINSRLDIVAGQTYLHVANNEYVIVTKYNQGGGNVRWSGIGFSGNMDAYSFIEQFPAVDPTDIDTDEIQALLQLCPEEVEEATIGFITEYDLHNLDEEEEEETMN